ncbi:MAG: glycosyltransferase [candidate division Zixibacteria bacterium]
MLNPRAFRWSAIAEQFASAGHTVDIVCSWMPGLATQEGLNGVTVHRVGGSMLEKIRSAVRPSSRSTTAGTSNSYARRSLVSKILSSVRTVARSLHDLTWKNMYWPDYACLWVGPASAKAIELVESKEFDRIITVSDPFSVHLVGRRLKRECPNLPWLVDIGDPFCFRHDTPTNNHWLYRALNYRCEREIFEMADRITVTVESTRAKYADLFPESDAKIEVIGPLLKTSDVTNESYSVFEPTSRKKLLFIGTLYRAIRNPQFLLELFSQLSERNDDWVELHFVGGYDDCRDICDSFKERLGNRLFFHGLMPRETVMQSVEEADLLINIGNSNPYQLPSKLVEYASAGKPILNISSIENDSSKIFLSNYDLFLNLMEASRGPDVVQVEAVEEFIRRESIINRAEKLDEIRRNFSAERIASQYMNEPIVCRPEDVTV